ncbi:hypothetical protein BAUCODRAFT_33552 [Baudoinia panamericana UAMH 10762]|uniref:Uncharacterized protein n=1 Tax=Baudoinia panamericana (strain UAMH 10762) TaxID=717646 RepID=M2MHU7_BAUPA|nr:uncharacterized protein BAUCODRAFT_33552 [Baudoinia panamericana UAMH 10762]EMC96206.1 hypothetical protein BAUCODRAFT_33552 [Baudoinia panamericana UAMH 10762]
MATDAFSLSYVVYSDVKRVIHVRQLPDIRHRIEAFHLYESERCTKHPPMVSRLGVLTSQVEQRREQHTKSPPEVSHK